MKKRNLVLTSVLGIILICIFLLIPKKTIDNLDNQNGLLTKNQRDIFFNQIKQFPNNTQMTISFIRDDSCVFYGVIKQNDRVDQIDNKYSLFEIGSITKVFTTTLLADFILDSTLSLNRYINADLDLRLKNDIQISYKTLANHTSGLPRRPSDIFFSSTIKSPLNPYKSYTTEKLESYLTEKIALNREAGVKYEYSNLGMGILGYALCKVAVSDYETLLKEKIFSKYGLANTTSVKDSIHGVLVPALGPFGNKTSNWDLTSLESAGNLVSSASDLSKFVKAHFDTNNIELALTRKSTFVKINTNEIGLGWHILKDKAESNWYFHNGGTGGYRCAVIFDVESRKGVIVLTNISIGHRKSDQIDEFCFELMHEL